MISFIVTFDSLVFRQYLVYGILFLLAVGMFFAMGVFILSVVKQRKYSKTKLPSLNVDAEEEEVSEDSVSAFSLDDLDSEPDEEPRVVSSPRTEVANQHANQIHEKQAPSTDEALPSLGEPFSSPVLPEAAPEAALPQLSPVAPQEHTSAKNYSSPMEEQKAYYADEDDDDAVDFLFQEHLKASETLDSSPASSRSFDELKGQSFGKMLKKPVEEFSLESPIASPREEEDLSESPPGTSSYSGKRRR